MTAEGGAVLLFVPSALFAADDAEYNASYPPMLRNEVARRSRYRRRRGAPLSRPLVMVLLRFNVARARTDEISRDGSSADQHFNKSAPASAGSSLMVCIGNGISAFAGICAFIISNRACVFSYAAF